jgi:hypothetical protein
MKNPWKNAILLLSCVGTCLAACTHTATESKLTEAPQATDETLPTVPQSPDPQISFTPHPLTEATPAIVIESYNPESTPTPPVPALSVPDAAISIYQPGPSSQVTSPFQVAGFGGPAYKDRVHLKLIGEDGKVLSEGVSYLLVLPGNAGRFYSKVPFEIEHVAETARLEVSTYGIRDHQLSQLASVDLILISNGNPLIHPAIHGPEKIYISHPREEAEVSGGTVPVQGAGWVDADVPLAVSVFDWYGDEVGTSSVRLDASESGQLGTFEVEVPYQISVPQWGRIAVSEPSTDIPGMIHYSSVQVWLAP